MSILAGLAQTSISLIQNMFLGEYPLEHVENDNRALRFVVVFECSIVPPGLVGFGPRQHTYHTIQE
jgi:hypothetical protein